MKNILLYLSCIFIGYTLHEFSIDTSILKDITTIYFNLLKMIIAPFIFFTVLNYLNSYHNNINSGIKLSIPLFLIISAVASIIGILCSVLCDITISPQPIDVNIRSFSIKDILSLFIPTSIYEPFKSCNVIQLFVLSCLCFLGIKDKSMNVSIYYNTIQDILNYILKFIPYIIGLLLICNNHLYNIAIISQYIDLILVMFICYILICLLYTIVFVLKADFYNLKHIVQPYIMAVSSCSSLLTLPLIIKSSNACGINNHTANILGVISSIFSRSGVSLYIAVIGIFFLSLYNINMTLLSYAFLFCACILLPLLTVGVPSSIIVVLYIIFTTYNIPLEGLGILMCVDRVFDIMRTSLNVLSSIIVTLLCGKRQ